MYRKSRITGQIVKMNNSMIHSNSGEAITRTAQMGSKGKFKKKSIAKQLRSKTAPSHCVQKNQSLTHPCSFCDFVCQSSSDLYLHQKILHMEEHLFSCNLCHYTCGKPSLLTLHMLMHACKTEITCVQCNMKFTHMYYLRRHLRNHLAGQKQEHQKKFKCSFCQKMFCWKINYKKHIKIHTNLNIYNCVSCDFSTNQIADLFDHKYSHDSEDGFFNCVHCQCVLSSWTNLEVHMLLSHAESYSKIENVEHGSACNLCGKIFYKFTDLQLHVIRTHANECSLSTKDENLKLEMSSILERKYLCSTCGTLLRTSSALKVHKCKCTEDKVFACSTCQQKFCTRSQLKSHEYVHTGHKPFLCSICPYKCRRKQYLNRHILTHSGKKSHLCTVCGQDFLFPETLNRHMHKHALERPYSCKMCSYCTSDNDGLKRHMAKHITNIYTCNDCTFTCNQNCDMQKHKLLHLTDKLISCSTCNLKFSNSKELQSHMLGHVDQNLSNYACNHCPYKCQIQKDYISHMQTHSVDKPFSCTECGYRSNRRMNLKVHMIKKHKLSLASVVSFTCNVCQYVCERDQDYIRHMTINHNIDKPFDCPVCPFATHRQSLLKVHQETHKPPAFFCHLCSFKCKRKTLLNKHLTEKHLIQNQEENCPSVPEHKLYFCKLCSFKSKHYASLRNHMPAHSGVKLACDECDYITYSKRNLTSHLRSHIKDKPFKCNFCSYSSARKNNFKLHMVRHMNEKLHFSDKCNFSNKNEADTPEHKHSHNSCLVTDEGISENVDTLNEVSSQEEANKIQFDTCYKIIKDKSQDTVLQDEWQENNDVTDGERQMNSSPSLVNGVPSKHLEKLHETHESVRTKQTAGYNIITNFDFQAPCQEKNGVMDGEKQTKYVNSVVKVNTSDNDYKIINIFDIKDVCQEKNIVMEGGKQSKSVHPVVNIDQLNSVQMLYQKPCQSDAATIQQTVGYKTVKGSDFQDVCQEINVVTERGKQSKSVHFVVNTDQSKSVKKLYQSEDNKKKQMACYKIIKDFYFQGECQERNALVEVLKQSQSGHSVGSTKSSKNVEMYQRSSHMEAKKLLINNKAPDCDYSNICPEENIGEDTTKQFNSEHPIMTSEPSENVDTLSKIVDQSGTNKMHRTAGYKNIKDIYFQGECEKNYPGVEVLKRLKSQHPSISTEPSENVKTLYQLPGQREATIMQPLSRYRIITDFDYSGKFRGNNVGLIVDKQSPEFDNNYYSCSNQANHEKLYPVSSIYPLIDIFMPKSIQQHAGINASSSNSVQPYTSPTDQSFDLLTSYTSVKKIEQKEYANLTGHVQKDSHNKIHQQPLHIQFCTNRVPTDIRHHKNAPPGVINSMDRSETFIKYSENELISNDNGNYHQNNDIHHFNHPQNEILHSCHNFPFNVSNSSKRITISSLQDSDSSRRTQIYSRHIKIPEFCPSISLKIDATHQNDFSTKEAITHSEIPCGENILSCKSCNFHCSTKETLKLHLLTHTSTLSQTELKLYCSICQFSFSNTEEFERHCLQCQLGPTAKEDHLDQEDSETMNAQMPISESTQTGRQPKRKHYRCFKCNYESDRPCSFKQHMLSVHDIEKAFLCNLCSYSTKREDDLKTHAITHNDKVIKSCSICTYTCKRTPALRRHLQKHKDVQLFSCHSCDFWCNYEPDMRSHILRTHEKPKQFTCKLCAFSTSIAIQFKKHMLEAHTIESAFKCSECDYSTPLWNNFRAHKQKHTTTKKYVCSLCGLAFKRLASLKNHKYNHSSIKSLTCLHCNYRCNLPEKLKIHMRRHRNERPYTCKICQRSYTHSSSLSHHFSSVHKNPMRYTCSECSYTTSTITQLKRHNRTHGKENIFQCKVCDFGCKHTEILNNHMLLHNLNLTSTSSNETKMAVDSDCQSNILPSTHSENLTPISDFPLKYNPARFKCPTSMQNFKTLSNFKKHKLKHQKSHFVHRLVCSICSFSCLRPHELKIHTSFHTGKKQYMCNMCDFACNKPYTLKYHKQKNHGHAYHSSRSSLYGCHICDFTSNKRIYLKYHLQEKHRTSAAVLLSSQNSATGTKLYKSVFDLSENSGKANENCHLVSSLPENLAMSTENCRSVCATSENLAMSTENCRSVCATSENLAMSTENCRSVCATSENLAMSTENCRSVCATSENLAMSTENCRSLLAVSENLAMSTENCRSLHAVSENLAMSTENCRSVHAMSENLAKSTDNCRSVFSPSQNVMNFSMSDENILKSLHVRNTAPRRANARNSPQNDNRSHSQNTYTVVTMNSQHTNRNNYPTLQNKNTNTDIYPTPQNINTVKFSTPQNTNTVKCSTPQNASIVTCCTSQNSNTIMKKFNCTECNYSCTRKGNLRTHLMRHTKKDFLCHLCDYMCRRERELKRHLLTHASAKPLSCSQCSYTCNQPASLKVHMLKHKGEKPIRCQICEFRCRQKSTLRDHMKTHSDVRMFACVHCDYKAKRSVCLKMHLLTHSTERSICCSLCDFTCKHLGALRSHMHTHLT